MLTNATLLRIDTPAPPLTSGATQYNTGAALSVRVFIGGDDAALAYQGDAKLTDQRNAIMRITFAAMGALQIPNLSHVLVQGDGDVPATYTVWSVERCPKGSLSFVEAKLLRD